MANCGICRESRGEVRVCAKESGHLMHTACLQMMLSSIGSDISLMRCPNCTPTTLLSMQLIMNLQGRGISIPRESVDAISTAIARRMTVENLAEGERLA